ncbi:MAG TPA: trigger factor [Alphaproteobacteria bacterium]|nr:trigger factor [Alphaproteobacteria bacterium]
MNITETAHEGLQRTWRVVVPATEIGANVDRRLAELSKTIRLPGFRPGKVPLGIVKKRYGSSILGEVLEKTVQDSSSQVLKEQAVRPALEPKIEVVNFAEGTDLEYTLAVETLPDVEPADLSGLALERPVVPVGEAEVDKALEKLREVNPTFEPVKQARMAKKGDQLVIDFAGTVDGVARPGMDGKDYPLELGSGGFIPGFEDQLIGIKPEETREITVTFPTEYHAAELAGKEAKFTVTAKELRGKVEATLDDEFAKKLGQADLGALKETVKTQLDKDYGQLSRLKLKRKLMDALAERHDFAVPQGMVDIEFDSIWRQIQAELEKEPSDKTEEEQKAEYRKIAERRVRLGLLLSEIGKRNNIQVAQEELNRALIAEARRFPGQERQVLEAYTKNPRALDALRAPIYEDKVVDHIFGMIQITDRTVTPDELTSDEDEAEIAA